MHSLVNQACECEEEIKGGVLAYCNLLSQKHEQSSEPSEKQSFIKAISVQTARGMDWDPSSAHKYTHTRTHAHTRILTSQLGRSIYSVNVFIHAAKCSHGRFH